MTERAAALALLAFVLMAVGAASLLRRWRG